jgi:hypothetical protein
LIRKHKDLPLSLSPGMAREAQRREDGSLFPSLQVHKDLPLSLSPTNRIM